MERGAHAPSRGLWPFWGALALAVAIIAVEAPRLDLLDLLKAEGRGVELASAVGLFCAVGAYLLTRGPAAATAGWQVAILLFAMGCRELDFDKRFLDEGILQLRLYSGSAPLWQKLIGAAVVIVILAALARLVRRDVGPWLRALAGRATWAWLVFAALVTVVVAKTIDGAGRKLAPLGVKLGERLDLALGLGEESLELVFALMLVLAICIAPVRRSLHDRG